MKITIDTKEDTHEEIKRVIDILSSMVSLSVAGQQPSQESQPVLNEGIFGMFSDNKEEGAAFANPEMPTSGEVAGMFSDSREEAINLPEPKVVEGIKKGDDGDARVVVY